MALYTVATAQILVSFLEELGLICLLLGFCLVSTSSYSNNQTQNPEAASDTLSRLAEPRSQLKDGIPSLGALLIPWPPSQGVVPLGPVVHVGGTATELAGSWDLSHRIVWRS